MRDAILVASVLWAAALAILLVRDAVVRDERGTYLCLRIGRRTWLVIGRWRP